MRQVFSSPRLENVERVAQLLRDAGIEVRITDGRSYKGGMQANFSYRDNARTDPVPAVWIVRSEDQPGGRKILRDAGMLDSTRVETGYTLPTFRSEQRDDPGSKRVFRLKVGLLVVIAVSLVVVLFGFRARMPGASAPRTAQGPVFPEGVAATPDTLAIAVLAGELPTRADQTVCLEVDNHDPAPAFLAALPASPGKVLPASQCAFEKWPVLAINNYRPEDGKITLERRRDAALLLSQTYDVRPQGDGWRVIEPYR